jgi:hypothetical protein
MHSNLCYSPRPFLPVFDAMVHCPFSFRRDVRCSEKHAKQASETYRRSQAKPPSHIVSSEQSTNVIARGWLHLPSRAQPRQPSAVHPPPFVDHPLGTYCRCYGRRLSKIFRHSRSSGTRMAACRRSFPCQRPVVLLTIPDPLSLVFPHRIVKVPMTLELAKTGLSCV